MWKQMLFATAHISCALESKSEVFPQNKLLEDFWLFILIIKAMCNLESGSVYEEFASKTNWGWGLHICTCGWVSSLPPSPVTNLAQRHLESICSYVLSYGAGSVPKPYLLHIDVVSLARRHRGSKGFFLLVLLLNAQNVSWSKQHERRLEFSKTKKGKTKKASGMAQVYGHIIGLAFIETKYIYISDTYSKQLYKSSNVWCLAW